MKTLRLFFFTLAVAAAAAIATPAQAQCSTVSGTACDGHKHLKGGDYPYTEDFANSNVQVNAGAGYVTIIDGCPERNYINFEHPNPAHVVLRASVRVNSATAPAGSRFYLRFTIDGQGYGGYARTLSGNYEQSEEINAVVYVGPGQHRIGVQVWLYDGPGSLTTGNSFLVAQGAPTSTGAASAADSSTITVDGTWRQISPTITINSATDVNLLVQGYFQVNSGTPGQKLALGFSLDGANSQHTIEVAVPRYFPSGINLFDHYKYKPGYINVPAGTHTISIWAINRDGGTAQFQYRQVEAIGFEATNDYETPMLEAIATTAKTVSTAGDGTTPFNYWLVGDCGKWTTLLEYSRTVNGVTYPNYPATTANANQNWVGEAYVEFNNTSGRPLQVQVAIEVLYNPVYDSTGKVIGREADADFSILEFTIPVGRSEKFVFTHPLWWGSNKPNHIRFMARSFTCFGQPAADFSVVKRYMAIKTIPAPGSCEFD